MYDKPTYALVKLHDTDFGYFRLEAQLASHQFSLVQIRVSTDQATYLAIEVRVAQVQCITREANNS